MHSVHIYIALSAVFDKGNVVTNAKEPRESGLREQKRKQTHARITEAGLRLFRAQGYEATTLDAIAAEAGISRRTFFHYFKSKDDILLSLQSGPGEALAAALAARHEGLTPFAAVRGAMLALVAQYPPDELIALDRLMRSSEAIQARKQASYARDEALVLEALRTHWPEKSDTHLRMVAMLAIGVSRVALDAWNKDGGRRPLADFLAEGFDAIEAVGGQQSG